MLCPSVLCVVTPASPPVGWPCTQGSIQERGNGKQSFLLMRLAVFYFVLVKPKQRLFEPTVFSHFRKNCPCWLQQKCVPVEALEI